MCLAEQNEIPSAAQNATCRQPVTELWAHLRNSLIKIPGYLIKIPGYLIKVPGYLIKIPGSEQPLLLHKCVTKP